MNTIELNASAAAAAPELRGFTIPFGRLATFLRRTVHRLEARLQSAWVVQPDREPHEDEQVIRLVPIDIDAIDIFADATWEDAEWQ